MPKPVDWKIHNLGDLLKQNPNALTVEVPTPETDPLVLEHERLAKIVQDRLQALREAKADLEQFSQDHR